jgi:hypothetical protein
VGAVKLVDLKIDAQNQAELSSAVGTAVVALPSRADGPVPLPLAPGD